jgi:predicted ATP-binding protein involved in virulence
MRENNANHNQIDLLRTSGFTDWTEDEIRCGWPGVDDNSFAIRSLTLIRYRCFDSINLSFHPTLTLFSAPNGEGKTAILDGIAISLRLFIDTLLKKKSSPGFKKEDIQAFVATGGSMENYLPQQPTRLSATALIFGQPVCWTRELGSDQPKAKTTIKDAKDLIGAARSLLKGIQIPASPSPDASSTPATLPLVSYYGTGRLFSQIKQRSSSQTTAKSRLMGYRDCLNPNSSYKDFLAWYAPMSSEAQAEQLTALSAGHQAIERLSAVNDTIREVLEHTGWKGVRWDYINKELLAFHSDGRIFPVRLLSDGVRNMLAMTADMVFRCSQLNPHLGNAVARLTPGIVLIDEIDMHLHPEWQQSVLSRLMSVFPKIQFLVSTHSPEVISTFSKEHIRVVRHGKVASPSKQTSGVPSDKILSNVMGVNPIWGELEAAKWLTRYHSLISQGLQESDEGVELRDMIISHYGQDSQQISECDQAIRLIRIRARISSSLTRESER